MMRTLLLLIMLSLTGCTQKLSDYQHQTPALDLQHYFNGHIKAWGVVSGRDGQVKRRFTATIQASWQGDIGTLDEQFVFDDGEQQHRVWTLQKQGDRYTGQAGDVIGTAQGATSGIAMNWRYVLEIPIDGEPWHFSVNDWLYLVDDGVLFNTGELSKFGITLGYIHLFMQKQ